MTDWVQTLLGKKYSPDQPRDPAGMSTGGQWAPGGSLPGSNVLAPDKMKYGERPEDTMPGRFRSGQFMDLAEKQGKDTTDPEVIEAVSDWKLDTTTPINEYLRTGKTPSGYEGSEQFFDKWVGNLDKAMTTELPENVVVYRATKNTGRQYVDKGFVSTSASADYAEYYRERFGGKVVPVIVPKGTRVAFIDFVGRELFTSEHELLLPRGGKFVKTETLDGTDAWVFWAPGSPANP